MLGVVEAEEPGRGGKGEDRGAAERWQLLAGNAAEPEDVDGTESGGPHSASNIGLGAEPADVAQARPESEFEERERQAHPGEAEPDGRHYVSQRHRQQRRRGIAVFEAGTL